MRMFLLFKSTYPDIKMNDVVGMKMIEDFAKLPNDMSNIIFCQ